MICIAGKNTIAVNALSWLLENGYSANELVVCINKTDNGVNGWQPSLQYHATALGVKIVALSELYAVEDLVFFSLEYDALIRPRLFRSSKLFNIHFSLLPAYKGMFTSVMPLLYGEKRSGCTLHKIDAGIDTGDIIDQIEFDIPVSHNSRDLYDNYLEHSFTLFERNFPLVISNSYQTWRQPREGSSYFSKTQLSFSSIKIDLNNTCWHIHNQVRAFCFRAYQLPVVNGHTIYKSEILATDPLGKSGTVYEENDYFIVLNTIDGQIKLYKDKADALFAAAEAGHLKTIRELGDAGYPIDVRQENGWNALIVATYHERKELVKWLLEYGFSVNDANYKGTTILMYALTAASKSGDLELMAFLIASGADTATHDHAGKNALEYAITYGNEAVIDFLKEMEGQKI